MDAARLAARQERADHAAGMRCREDAADRQIRLVERGVGGEKRLVPQIDHAEARRPDETRAGVLQELPDPRLARRPFRAGLGKTVGERGHDRHADPCALLDRLHRGVGRRDDIGVLGHLRQSGERRPGALAQHLVAPRIDRIDAAGIAGLPQIFQRPAGGLGRVVRLPDDRDRLRREQHLRQRLGHSAASEVFGLGGRWSNLRSNTCSAMRFFSISTEPPAIIQPRQRRMQYSTSEVLL